MTYPDIREAICDVCHKMWQLGWVAANDGNISVRTGENRIWVTPAGVSKGYMTEDQLVCVDLDGNVVTGDTETITITFGN